MNVNKKKYYGLDVAKFLCALLILYYHYFSEHGPVPTLIDEGLSLYAVAVALFMVISGFLLFDKLLSVTDKSERKKIIKNQFLRIMTIYIIWSIPYLIYSISRWDFTNIDLFFILSEIQKWIFKSTFFTIWFMPSLAFGILFTVLVTSKLKKNITYMLAFLLYLLGSLTLTYSFFGTSIPGYEYFYWFSETWLGGSRGWLFYAFPMLMVGKTLAEQDKRVKLLPSFILSGSSLILMLAEALILRKFAGHTGIDMTIFMIPTVYFATTFFLNLSFKSIYDQFFTWMRKMSTLIFMSQRIFLTVLPNLFPLIFYDYIFKNNWIGSVFIGIMVLGTSSLIIKLSHKYKVLKKIY